LPSAFSFFKEGESELLGWRKKTKGKEGREDRYFFISHNFPSHVSQEENWEESGHSPRIGERRKGEKTCVAEGGGEMRERRGGGLICMHDLAPFTFGEKEREENTGGTGAHRVTPR